MELLPTYYTTANKLNYWLVSAPSVLYISPLWVLLNVGSGRWRTIQTCANHRPAFSHTFRTPRLLANQFTTKSRCLWVDLCCLTLYCVDRCRFCFCKLASDLLYTYKGEHGRRGEGMCHTKVISLTELLYRVTERLISCVDHSLHADADVTEIVSWTALSLFILKFSFLATFHVMFTIEYHTAAFYSLMKWS